MQAAAGQQHEYKQYQPAARCAAAQSGQHSARSAFVLAVAHAERERRNKAHAPADGRWLVSRKGL